MCSVSQSPSFTTLPAKRGWKNHAPMEPMNATAKYTPDRCEVWGPTQNGEAAFAATLAASGLPADKCEVYKLPIGGGFGKRVAYQDYVTQAVLIAKQIQDAPHETLLTVDATTGQNGLRQARMFSEAIGVTGLVLTKLDGTAKGGIALAIAAELGIPVKLIGTGEQLEDLRPFEPSEYARALIG